MSDLDESIKVDNRNNHIIQGEVTFVSTKVK